MRRYHQYLVAFVLIVFTGLYAQPATAQINYRSTNVFSAKILGTSTLHDWEMSSPSGNCVCTVLLDGNNKIIGVSSLSFVIKVESFVSEHKLMNTKTYEALKSDKFPTITYTLTSATVTQLNATTALIKTHGKLTIAGVTKDSEIDAYCAVSATDQSISCKVTKKMKMSDFNVKPPVVLMGTIKTGNDISIEFNFKLVK
jgi:polyisoprenoid-binding protein YceI